MRLAAPPLAALTLVATLFATLFATGTAFWPGLIGGATAPRWAAMALGLAGLAWRVELRPQAAHALLLAGLGYAALSLAWAADPTAGVDDLVHLALFGLAVAAGMALDDLRPARIGAALACLAMLPFCVHSVNDATGLFYNRDQLAQFAALAAVGVLGLELRLWPLALPAVLSILLSHSLGGLAALAIGVLALGWRRVPPVLRFPLIVLLLMAAAWVSGMPGVIENSIAPRLIGWRLLLGELSWRGAGIGGVAAAHPSWGHAHNDLLQLGYEFGLGALPFVALAMLAVCRRAPGLAAERAVLLGFLAEGMIGFPLYSPATALLGGLVAGRLIGAGASLCRRDAAGRAADRPALRRNNPAGGADAVPG